MLDLLTFIIVVVVLFGLVIENIRLKNKNTQLVFMLSQSLLDLEGVKRSVFVENKQEEVQKDHLISFLSETREVVFDEIEKLQNAVKEFIDIADKNFAYFDKYGILSEGDLFYETMLTVSAEYKKLKQFLPEEDNDGR